MLKNENIICISSIDWDFIWQGHQEIMSTFSKNGNKVLFIENTGVRKPNIADIHRLIKRGMNWFKSVRGFREINSNLCVFSPIVLPFPYSKSAKFINKFVIMRSLNKWIKAVRFYDPIIWTYLPTGLVLDIINSLDKKLLVYYCVADFEELAENPEKIKITENKLIKQCDLVFVQVKSFKDKCNKFNKNVFVFPMGVKMELFADYNGSKDDIPDDIINIKKPIIGYVGGVHRHIDFELIEHVAKGNPDWSIVFIGPIQTDISRIDKLLNVFFLGQKEVTSLQHYIKQFEVCMIPYQITEYTKTVYPTKMNEYHAMGKVVVSTRLPEVVEFNKDNDNLIMVASTKDEFVKKIEEAVFNGNEELCYKRITSAKSNNWQTHIEEMSDLIKESIKSKPNMIVDGWQEKFLGMCKVNRNRIALPFFVVATLYLLIFYTPIIWAVAYPLKIVDSPKQADVIAVLGGGVGEGGGGGQSTLERAKFGVNLYNKKYAKNLIFSSGYESVYKEADKMKLIATTLGVPEESIILEQHANDTYENVKYISMIMKENGWDSVLVITSPYNMRRVSLVFNNFDDNIEEIIYTPVLNSKFYKSSGNRWAQIKAIAHEYLGIIYYWCRGYI